ncbi:NAD-P-binding protein [Laetiporus sulphureus 93-53]|uniref:NAD-P-binding protein n=1 Tax=Laetiporus sulphureus 93-53 TaxID=1314785 RepID=A0A165DLE4_9APHY|nr:NAD-P-binding protein [Laetiporus sulphureus 93-53]KZT05140.1 NAD-P-binding protein [Laetiporus sulphureus 93-53]
MAAGVKGCKRQSSLRNSISTYAVVGASRGIGLELVHQLSSNRDNVVYAIVRKKATATHLTNNLVSTLPTGNVHIFEADVADHRALEAVAKQVTQIGGGAFDVLIHNAARMEGVNLFRGLMEYEDEDTSYKVNVLGVIPSVNAFLPLLRRGTMKKVVIIGSEGGNRDFVWKMRVSSVAAYGTTKAAEAMVAMKYAALLEYEGFTVVTLSPGVVDVSAIAVDNPTRDDAAKEIIAGLVARLRQTVPDFRTLTPEESVKRLLATIESTGPAKTGSFQSVMQS